MDELRDEIRRRQIEIETKQSEVNILIKAYNNILEKVEEVNRKEKKGDDDVSK
ncbi:hypothetical protein [uncultured Clostridium sp.]|uniref:hypothetical protein n=1 Tax=uncultured Clostridium sp. TaxID=59620 RepID=UPI002638CDEA|nr:hypothetical protein [uncultured Clostridium sp.]